MKLILSKIMETQVNYFSEFTLWMNLDIQAVTEVSMFSQHETPELCGISKVNMEFHGWFHIDENGDGKAACPTTNIPLFVIDQREGMFPRIPNFHINFDRIICVIPLAIERYQLAI